MPAELARVRKTLKTCFENIDCFLMPNPGDFAKENNFSGALHPLTESFRSNLRLFIDELLVVDELKPIKIGNHVINGSGLFQYFERYVELFNSKTLPPARSLYEGKRYHFYMKLKLKR